jgi:hypothetical protein
MQLVFGKKSQPIYAILLVFSKLCVDCYWDIVLLDFAPIKQLLEEVTLHFSSLQQVFRKTWRVWQASLIARQIT